jgi:tripartite-type tricarboxylate transporter receptor subunit TctC
MKQLLAQAVSCLAAALLASGACAQAQAPEGFPARPVRLIVPYPPGGSDAYARLIAARMQENLGKPFVVENRPGAGGNVGAEYVARAAPDGHTLLFAPSGLYAINPAIYPAIPFQTERDFAPVAFVGSMPLVALVAPSVSAQNMQQLVSLARSQPGQLAYGSAGNGTIQHLAGEMLRRAASVDILHVPFKGAGPAMQELLAGRIQLMFDALTNAVPQLSAGRVRGLATTGAARAPVLSELPTMAEAGFPGFEAVTWFAVTAPAATPAPIVRYLNAEMNRAIAAPEVRASLEKVGLVLRPDSPEALAAFMREESKRFAEMVRAFGVKVD